MSGSSKMWEWIELPGIRLAGAAFFEGKRLTQETLAQHILEGYAAGRIGQALHVLNGNFAFVILDDGEIRALGVDRTRSIPLFYRIAEGERCLASVAARDIVDLSVSFEPVESEVFLRSGYVLGSNTLHPDLRQVVAGSIVHIGDGGDTEIERYHRHTRFHGGEADSIDLSFDHLDELSRNVGERMVTALDGGQALVPLSGGYDSRYILSMLIEQEYDNIQLFTYGTPTGIEAKIAKQVADIVDLPWEFIDYTDGGLQEYVRSEEFSRYWATAGNAGSLPHVQEPYALAELRRRGLLQDGSTVLPGFCGDVLGGSYIPFEASTNEIDQLMAAGLSAHIADRFLYLDNDLCVTGWSRFRSSIDDSLSHVDLKPNPNALISEANAWAAENRVARFVVNALRAYEFQDLDWYMPLWDSELMDSWYQVPLKRLVSEAPYDSYLLEHRFAQQGISFKQKPALWSGPLFRKAVTRVPSKLKAPLWQLRDKLTGTRRFDVNAFGPIAEWAMEGVDELVEYDGNINRVLVHRYLSDTANGMLHR